MYLSICCNLAHIPHPSFSTSPVPYAIAYKRSNSDSLNAAVEAAAEFLNKAVRPVIVNGVRVGACSTLTCMRIYMRSVSQTNMV